jgi:predicted dehydrogenase
MSENQTSDFNRRDFLKGGSAATLMTLLGGVELFAQTNTNTPPDTSIKYVGPKLKVGLIGLGTWGREILTNLGRLDQVEISAICDTYPGAITRAAKSAPNAEQTKDYKTILDNKDITTVIVATPPHQHKDIVLAALKADKHVYCEAPLANTIEDARAIALAAKAAKQSLFQAGLQTRADPQRLFLLPFVRAGSLGQWAMVRAQWHKKQSWRATSPSAEREKELNWRLNKETSLGLAGEFGIHSIDVATWFLNKQPRAVSGFGALTLWKDDGRDVPDTVQALFEFPAGVTFHYDATLANSFDDQYEMFYGSDAAIMLRESKAWLFKEVDSPNFGWEVYTRKESFYKETGYTLLANASKSVVPGKQATAEVPKTPLYHALNKFTLNAVTVVTAKADFISNFGGDDPEALKEHLSKTMQRPPCGYEEAYRATVTAIKTNEAINNKQRVVLQPEWYELT